MFIKENFYLPLLIFLIYIKKKRESTQKFLIINSININVVHFPILPFPFVPFPPFQFALDLCYCSFFSSSFSSLTLMDAG